MAGHPNPQSPDTIGAQGGAQAAAAAARLATVHRKTRLSVVARQDLDDQLAAGIDEAKAALF